MKNRLKTLLPNTHYTCMTCGYKQTVARLVVTPKTKFDACIWFFLLEISKVMISSLSLRASGYAC